LNTEYRFVVAAASAIAAVSICVAAPGVWLVDELFERTDLIAIGVLVDIDWECLDTEPTAPTRCHNDRGFGVLNVDRIVVGSPGLDSIVVRWANVLTCPRTDHRDMEGRRALWFLARSTAEAAGGYHSTLVVPFDDSLLVADVLRRLRKEPGPKEPKKVEAVVQVLEALE